MKVYLFFLLGVDLLNDENYVAGVKNIKKNTYLKDRIQKCSNMKFTTDGRSLLYLSYNEKRRSDKLYVRRLTGFSSEDVPREDTLVYEEKQENFYLDLNISKDKKYIILTSSSKEITEILVKNRGSNPEASDFLKIIDKSMKCKAYCNHSGNNFYLLTDSGNVFDFKVVTFPDEDLKNKARRINYFYTPESCEDLYIV